MKHARSASRRPLRSMRTMIEQRKRRKGKIIILLNKLLKVIFGKSRVAFHGKKMKKPNYLSKTLLHKAKMRT